MVDKWTFDYANLKKIERCVGFLDMIKFEDDKIVILEKESTSKRIGTVCTLLGFQVSNEVVKRLVEYEYDHDESAEVLAKRLGISIKENQLQMVMNVILLERYLKQVVKMVNKFEEFKLDLRQLEYWDKILTDKIYTESDKGLRQTGESNLIHPVEMKYKLDEWIRDYNDKVKNISVTPVEIVELVRELVKWQPTKKTSEVVGYYLIHLGIVISGYDRLGLLAMTMTGYKTTLTKDGWADSLMQTLAGEFDQMVSRVRHILMGRVEYKGPTKRNGLILSERQAALIDAVKQSTKLTVKEARDYVPFVSDDTILRELKTLVEMGVIKKKGSTKGAHYVLIKTR